LKGLKMTYQNNDIINTKASENDLPDAATVADLAAYLGVSTGLVYKMNRLGKIPGSFKVGTLIRFRSSAVIEWVRQGGNMNTPGRN
jgi:excisionase family DNA binding protein